MDTPRATVNTVAAKSKHAAAARGTPAGKAHRLGQDRSRSIAHRTQTERLSPDPRRQRIPPSVGQRSRAVDCSVGVEDDPDQDSQVLDGDSGVPGMSGVRPCLGRRLAAEPSVVVAGSAAPSVWSADQHRWVTPTFKANQQGASELAQSWGLESG